MQDAGATFQGFHPEAVVFFRGLATDNSKAYWQSHRDAYEAHVRQPLLALASTLEGAFGVAHVYRPYRDLRFSRDKRPYKEHMAVSFGGRGASAPGRYVQFDPSGLLVGAGAYRLLGESLTGYRRAVDDANAGEALEGILNSLTEIGYAIEGDVMKRGPRDAAPDHPRLELLKRKGLFVSSRFALEPWVFEAEAADRIARVFADAEPLIAWMRSHVT